MPSSSISGIRVWRWAVIGGTCFASTLALWCYLKRRTSDMRKHDDGNSRPVASIAPYQKLTPEEMKNKGNDLFKQFHYAEAVEVFTKAIELCPPEEKSHLAICFQNRAAAYQRLEETLNSIDDCSKAIELYPHYVKAVVRRGKAYLTVNKAEDALIDLTYATMINPDMSQVIKSDMEAAILLTTANFIDHMKKTREPIPIREELVLVWRSCFVNDPILLDIKENLEPSNPYNRALDAVRRGKYEEVISLLELDLLDNINDVSCLRDNVFIARFCLMKENIEMMKERLQAFNNVWENMDDKSKCEVIVKRYRSIYFILLGHLKIVENMDISEELINAIDIDESNVDAYLGAAFLLSDYGRLTEAIACLDRLSRIDPEHYLVKHIRANYELALKASSGDVCGAMACIAKIDQLLQQNSDADPILYLMTGKLFYAAQNRELAKSLFAKAAESYPTYSAPLFYLTIAEVEEIGEVSEQPTVLEEKMKSCLALEKSNPDALSILAKMALKRSRYDEALILYEQCIAMCPLRTHELNLAPAIHEYVELRAVRDAAVKLRLIGHGTQGD